MRPVFAIDVDGVLTDTNIVWEKTYFERRCGRPHPAKPSRWYWDCWKDLCPKCWNTVLHEPDILYQHRLQLGAYSALTVLSHSANLCVVTSRPRDVESITEQWLVERGIRDLFRGVYHADEKRTVCEQIGAKALLDDAPRNITGLFGSDIVPIIWDTPYNQSIEGKRVFNWIDACVALFELI